MRLFPRAARRRLLASSLAAVAVGGLFTSAAQADHGHQLKQQQHAVQGQEKHAQRDLDGSSRQLIAAQQALGSAVAQLNGARRYLASVDARLLQARAAHQALVVQLQASRAQLDQSRSAAAAGLASVASQRTAVRQSILHSYGAGSPQMAVTQALIDGTSLDDVALQQSYNAAQSQLQANTYQQLQSAQVLLTVHQQDVARATARVAAQEQQAADAVAQILKLRTQAVAARDRVAQLVVGRRSAERAAADARAADAAVLARLKKREIQIEKKILALAATDPNRTVAQTSGMFLSPVAGNTYITSPFGWRMHPIYHYWELHNGDDLAAPCGTPEVAIATGRVIEEYYNVAWGNRLYLDLGNVNGHNYTAIYNHISAYRSHVGEVVGRGQTVALAGTTGWSTGCHLHFTIMRDGVAIDPTHLIGM